MGKSDRLHCRATFLSCLISPESMDLERENRLLKRRLASLTEEAAKNESILRRSQKREMELLEADSLPRLLKLLVRGLADSCL